MSREDRKAMILRDHSDLSLSRQCRLLTISRSSFYYALKGESPENLTLMRRMRHELEEGGFDRFARDWIDRHEQSAASMA